MANFNHLKSLNVDADKTAEFKITEYGFEKPIILIGRPAMEENRDLFNAQAKRHVLKQHSRQAKNISLETLQQQRNDDREDYARHVLVGWKNVNDDNGKPVPFTRKDAYKFLCALPDRIFDEARMFFSQPAVYIAADDTEDFEKNSLSG